MTLLSTLSTWPILETSFANGGLSAIVYQIAMAHANDHANPEAMVSILVGLLLASSIGASISPFFAALAMKWVGPDGLYLYCSVIYASLAGFTYCRRTRRAPAPETTDFVAKPQSSQSSAVVVGLDPRTDDIE